MQAHQHLGRRAAMVATLTVALSACGGGGGSDPGPGPGPGPAPAGLPITSSNYVAVAQQAVSSSLSLLDSSDLVLGAEVGDDKALLRFALAQTDKLDDWFKRAPRVVSGAVQTLSEPCTGGGRLDMSVDDKNNNNVFDTGDTISVQAINCVEEGSTINGGIEIVVTAMSGVYDSDSYTAGMTMRLNNLSSNSPTESSTGNGEMRINISATGPNRASTTIEVPSFVSSGRLGGVSFTNTLSGFRLVVVKAPGGTLYTVSVSVSGAMSSSALESKQVSIDTPAPLLRNWNAVYPTSGQMVVRGGSGSQLRITAQAGGTALVELDADGNGSYETSVTKPWSELR